MLTTLVSLTIALSPQATCQAQVKPSAPPAAKTGKKPAGAKKKTGGNARKQGKKKKEPTAPQACRTVADETAKLLTDGSELLIKEVRLREDGSVDRGVAAFDEWVLTNKAGIKALRDQADEVDKTLTEADRELCRKHAHRIFHKLMDERFKKIAAYYQSRRQVFRTLGSLFR